MPSITSALRSATRYGILGAAIFTTLIWSITTALAQPESSNRPEVRQRSDSSSSSGHVPASPSPTSTPGCLENWTQSPAVNPGEVTNILRGVTAISANNVWAVGNYTTQQGGHETLIQHWDGVSWNVVDSPNMPLFTDLRAVTAIGPNDMWTVGNTRENNNVRTVTAHWNGTSWSVVPSPNFGGDPGLDTELTGVWASATNDVWAVGMYHGSNNLLQTFIIHWDGVSWNIVDSPNVPGGYNSNLNSISGSADDDIWAVGGLGGDYTLAMHWDGVSWNIVDAGAYGDNNYLTSVVALAPDDVWAGGVNHYSSDSLPLLIHWDGISWTQAVSPNTFDTEIFGLAAAGPDNIWAVGESTAGSVTHTFTERWNGTSWQVVQSPNPGSVSNRLLAVSVIPQGDVWAVGDLANSEYASSALIERNVSTCPLFTPTPTPPPTCQVTGDWTRLVPADPHGGTLYYQGVSGLSPDDLWLVGNTNYPSKAIVHWDGTSWKRSTLNSEPGDSALYDVVAFAPDDAWAVGFRHSNTQDRALAMHWNGISWSNVQTPLLDNLSYLVSVSGSGPNDIWAVGKQYDLFNEIYRTLIFYYDGTSWAEIASPNVGQDDNILTGVKVLASNDAWAAGYYWNGTFEQTLIMHWDGATWNVVSSPNAGGGSSRLMSITGTAPNNIWAVGESTVAGERRLLIEHWDGASWSIVEGPDLGAVASALTSVSASSTANMWAAGITAQNGTTETLILHWSGSSWVEVASPSPGETNSVLTDIWAYSPSENWAAGSFETPPGTGSGSLVLRNRNYDPCPLPTATPSPTPPTWTNTATSTPTGTFLTPTPTSTATSTPMLTPVPTQTPGEPSATPTPTSTHTGTPGSTSTLTPMPSGTATTVVATPTACAIEFSDVRQGSTFYEFVRCMACRGIINGYTSGCETGNPCFRPNNNVTRGQLSKIVANAAGFIEPAGAQQFEDVLPGSTFYDFVWRLASREYASGYQCGGLGEPCGTGNLPYFRPNGNASRGQISKIVSNAAGYSEPGGTQIFEDVVPGSTFYDFVQRLASRSVMSGYACGGAGEPCNQPDNRPYFRPPSLATRGQTSKIVANTFYPGCQTPFRKQQ